MRFCWNVYKNVQTSKSRVLVNKELLLRIVINEIVIWRAMVTPRRYPHHSDPG